MASIGHVPEHVPDVWHGGRTLAVRCWRRFATASQGCSWPRRWRPERRRGNPAASSWRERAPPLRRCGRWHRPTASGQPVPGSTPSARSIRTAPAAGEGSRLPSGELPASLLRSRRGFGCRIRSRFSAGSTFSTSSPRFVACSRQPAALRSRRAAVRRGRRLFDGGPAVADAVASAGPQVRMRPTSATVRHGGRRVTEQHAKDPPVKAQLARVLQRRPHAADPRSDRREVPRPPGRPPRPTPSAPGTHRT